MKTIGSILIIAASLVATENFIEALTTSQLARLDSVANTFSLSDGCKGTISKTRTIFSCPESQAFYNYGAWYAKEDKPVEYIVDKLKLHNVTYYSPKKYVISPSFIPAAGDTKSPISIVAYVTSDCPHCKKVGIPLRDLVLGYYKGKAQFQIKPIHQHIGDYALLAAVEQGKAWELFEAYGDIEGRMDEDAVIKAATAAKLDVVKLKKRVNSNTEFYKKIIEKNYVEAKKNGLNFTPTLYFNGYMYETNKHPIWIMEYIDYLLRTKKYMK